MAEMAKKIHYYDTDSGGVVYYANYLKYFEEARTEYMCDKGVSVKELLENDILFVVRRVEIDYKVPARYGDKLTILTEIIKIKNVSLEFFQLVKKDGELLVCAKIQIACVDGNFRPRILSREIAGRLKNSL